MIEPAIRDTVLLVDPHQGRRALHRGEIQRAGYAVVEARTGEEAIRVVYRERPCAVVMGCSIPGVSGLRTTEVLKDEPEVRDIPILLLASASDEEEARSARQARCDAYLEEPESSAEILATLERLAGPRRRRERPDRGVERSGRSARQRVPPDEPTRGRLRTKRRT